MSKQASNIKEVQSRGAKVISFVRSSLKTKDTGCSFKLPDLDDDFMPVPSVVALQLLAYYVSSDKGLDVDKPRNLAKVVTVYMLECLVIVKFNPQLIFCIVCGFFVINFLIML